jgi:hypothetical protein
MGGQYEYVGARSTTQDNLNGIFFMRSDQPFSAADPRTYPERLQVRVPGALNTFQKAHFASAFAQDKWTVAKRTTLSLGMRYDIELQPLREVDNPRFSDPNAYPVDRNNFQPACWASPTISAVRPLSRTRRVRTLLRQDPLRADLEILTAGVSRRPSTRSFRRTTRTRARRSARSRRIRCWRAVQRGTTRCSRLCIRAGSRIKNTGTVTLDDPDRTIPYSDQFTAGYERQLAPNLSASARLHPYEGARAVHAPRSESGRSRQHGAYGDARARRPGVHRAGEPAGQRGKD